MKKIFCCYQTICYYYNKIHLVDKCLLCFMLVLLLQSTFSLLILPCSSGEAHTIDVIVRTSISGIFGYFLSANFIRQESTSQKGNTKTKTPTTLNNTEDAIIKNRIGFTPLESETELKPGNISFTSTHETDSKKDVTGKLQIIVAAFIGLFCLIMLILVRNLCALHILDLSDSSFIATVSQFRDLVSGCVGFLIGCPSIIKNKS